MGSTSSPLEFSELRKANEIRCEALYHAIDDWSPTDWACAAAGEMGEACNLIKKMRRGEDISLNDVAYELADTVIYLDLLAARLGIDLAHAIAAKFNKVSIERESPVRLSCEDGMYVIGES